MGADGSKMGVTAMSIVSGIQKEDIDKLRSSFQTFADRAGGNKDVSREDFDSAVKSLEKLEQSDAELLDKLFVLLDETGENKVDIKDFLVASSLLVNYATAKDKLKFAFTIFDDGETGSIFALDCRKVLTTINLTASFFGDAVLSTGDIKDLIDAIWLECSIPSAPMTYLDHLDFIVNHEISVRFCSGQGTVRFEN
jgi:Ca2+-binding EF-hand superfamily protein